MTYIATCLRPFAGLHNFIVTVFVIVGSYFVSL